MKAESLEAALETFRAYTDALPPVAAIKVAIAGYDGQCLRLTAPLANNVNDKGSAFGGSMTSLMTYAGWGLVSLQVQQAGLRADVFVADSAVRYRTPLYADLQALATLAPGESWGLFLDTLRQRGRARIGVQARISLSGESPAEEQVMADLSGRYVAIAKG